MVTNLADEAAVVAALKSGTLTTDALFDSELPFYVALSCLVRSEWRGADEPVTVIPQKPGEPPLHIKTCVCGAEFVMPAPAPARGRCPGCGARYEAVIWKPRPGLTTII